MTAAEGGARTGEEGPLTNPRTGGVIIDSRTMRPPEWETYDEREWFERGVRRGWLHWSSICSAHQEQVPDCVSCNVGSWTLRAFNGRWYQRPLLAGRPMDDAVMARAWALCNAERPLDGSTKFDLRPCSRHIAEAATTDKAGLESPLPAPGRRSKS